MVTTQALHKAPPVSRFNGSPASALPLAPQARDAVKQASAAIAPTWPLDSFIAVNPLWGHTHRPLEKVAETLAALSGASVLMPRAWYAQARKEGRLTQELLQRAHALRADGTPCPSLDALLSTQPVALPTRALVVDVADGLPGSAGQWRPFVEQRMGQCCASYFDRDQALLQPMRDGGLYAVWRRMAQEDRGPALLLDAQRYAQAAAALPLTAEHMLARALEDLEIPASEQAHYLLALLLSVNGWASWCAYLGWTARLDGREDTHLEELLAIRLGWEWLVWRQAGQALRPAWQHAREAWPAVDRKTQDARRDDWLLQRALELSLQDVLANTLSRQPAAGPPPPPVAQAVFCIDVRSEVYRRALEQQETPIQTLGFAGFFGLPVAYRQLPDAGARPQLPGLLAPRFVVEDSGVTGPNASRRRSRLLAAHAWQALRHVPAAGPGFVESLGLLYAGKLLASSLGHAGKDAATPDQLGLDARQARGRAPRLTHQVDGQPLTPADGARLAEGMLRGMSLTQDLARVVLLVGHGSQTTNNAHAAGMDCGACCGQTGEVNARAAAALLNDPDVRRELVGRGVEVPPSTRFVAALHNTTTDEVVILEEEDVPASHAQDLAALRAALAHAGARARRERAVRLGLQHLPDAALHQAVRSRARDWAQVRPEWGLAGNAAFIVAPRARTRGVDLAGRAFLHEYRSDQDPDGAVLELIMTAPMVVTHWINFQYYMSTVDNARYGSGNKTLHNVVGTRLGVFEGNGGDLRIGLPLQCLHDGKAWVHEPLRLSVFIEAPRAAMDRVLEKHAHVRQLVDNGWLHLFQLEPGAPGVHARRGGMWHRVA